MNDLKVQIWTTKNFWNKFCSDEEFCANSIYTEFQNIKKG